MSLLNRYNLQLIKNFVERPSPYRIKWINFAITYRCNSRCSMCDIWKKYQNTPNLIKKELSLEDIRNCFETSKTFDLIGIGITGGEPFLRDDFVDICGVFTKKFHNINIAIATNGLNSNLIVNKTNELINNYNLKYLDISISLDGIGKTHNMARGVPLAYEKVMKTVRMLQQLKNNINLNLSFSFTITPENYNDLYRVCTMSKKLKMGVGIRFADTSQIYYDNSYKKFNFSDYDIQKIQEILNRISEEENKNIVKIIPRLLAPYSLFRELSIEYIKNPKRLFNCYSGIHSLFLDPYGNVYPCIMLDKKMGNILDKPFDKVWLSENSTNIRNFIKNKYCHCWTGCEVNHSLWRDKKLVWRNLVRLWKKKPIQSIC